MSKKKTKTTSKKAVKNTCECTCTCKSFIGKVRVFLDTVVSKIKSVL